MTPTTEELAKRLRESCPVTQDMASAEICDNYTEAADALEALAARVVALEEATGWQPIETAPKDGTPVLIGWDSGFWQPIIAHNEGEQWGILSSEMRFIPVPFSPTHWMPLPPAPKEGE